MENLQIILEIFGSNLLRGKEKGLSVQEIANMNKDFAMMNGISEIASEQLVALWVKECQNFDIMTK